MDRNWSIDEVVKWSQTGEADPSDLFDLFAPPGHENGCMRWGLCETVAAAGDMPWSQVEEDLAPVPAAPVKGPQTD